MSSSWLPPTDQVRHGFTDARMGNGMGLVRYWHVCFTAILMNLKYTYNKVADWLQPKNNKFTSSKMSYSKFTTVNIHQAGQMCSYCSKATKSICVYIYMFTDIIDPAVLRPGRLDKTLYVGLPTAGDRLDILMTITKVTSPNISAEYSCFMPASPQNVKCSY